MWIKRSGFVFITIFLIMLALIFRIFYISFSDIKKEVKEAAGGRVATLNIYNSKGIIYDRNLSPLAGNQFVYYLVINPRGFDRANLEYLSEITNTDTQAINEKLNRETIFVLQSFYEPKSMNGVYSYTGTARYPSTCISSHLVGYLDSDNKVGISGVEKAFDTELDLFSASTTIKYTTNAVRGAIGTLSLLEEKTAEDSKNGIVLTLDKTISLAAKNIMSKYITEGSLIIMDANNGDILTMLSYPEFEAKNIEKYLNSEKGELINNSTVNQTVGSVFKMILAACAIEYNVDSFEYECTGGISVGDRVFNCQNNKGHGKQNLKEAFSNSCNSYFIALGQLLGYDKIIEISQLFGVDCKIEICKDMFSSAGNLPEESGILSVANLSIGQGELMISPLQIARITAVLCNGGYLLNPNIYKSMYVDDKIINESEYQFRSQIISSDNATILKNMCISCVEEGTGKSAKPEKGGAGGKTASAQTGKYSDNKEILNTYFTGFYPANEPKYVITIFAKNGISGASTCAPVFKEICDFLCENY